MRCLRANVVCPCGQTVKGWRSSTARAIFFFTTEGRKLLVDRTHKRWIIATVTLFALATAGYVAHARASLNPPTGGSPVGLAFGVASAAMIVFAALFGLRRKVPTWRVGRLETWLKAHIWLGLLCYPLAFYHGGFRLGGPLTLALMVLLTLVVASGIVGLVLQQVLPRVMTARVPMETIYEQIDQVLEQLAEEADSVASSVCGDLFPLAAAEAKADRARRKKAVALEGSADLKTFHLEWVRPFLAGQDRGLGPLSRAADRGAMFDQVRVTLPPPLAPALARLEGLCEERRQLLAQKRLHHWLTGWLFVHLPATVALLVLLAAHAVTALRY
jgi:hypothetical protein